MPLLPDRFWSLLSSAFDWALRPLLPLGPVGALGILAGLTGFATVYAFGLFSDQARLRRVRSHLQAGLLAMSLYGNSPTALPRILWTLCVESARYLRLSLRPLLVVSVPLLVLFIQLDARFSHRPLRVGEAVLVSLAAPEDVPAGGADQLRATGTGVTVETAAVRVPSLGRVFWRVRAQREGSHALAVGRGRAPVATHIEVGPPGPALGPASGSEEDSPRGVGVLSVHYPALQLRVWRVSVSWLTWFLTATFGAAWLAKSVLKVSL